MVGNKNKKCKILDEYWEGNNLKENMRNKSVFHQILVNYPLTPDMTASLADPKDLWDENHVRMPNSFHCEHPFINYITQQKELKLKWTLISEAYSVYKIQNSFDLIQCIESYNKPGRWNFDSLISILNSDNSYLSPEEISSFFSNILPKIQSIVLDFPKIIMSPLPLLKKNSEMSITLSQKQIACLLSMAFLCTFPRRNARGSRSEYFNYPDINFKRLFEKSSCLKLRAEKYKCLFNYFRRILGRSQNSLLTFTRRSFSTFPDWSRSSKVFGQLTVNSEGSIETHGFGLLQVDFANSFIGGGVLGQGTLQEEIRFLICPELIVSRLFTEKLEDHECLLIFGCEQFSTYSGYASSFRFKGDFLDETPIDEESAHRKTAIVAIDALHFERSEEQYKKKNIDRELNKAYVGFYNSNVNETGVGIATGNWGCGAFGGDPYCKSLLQLMAAAESGRHLTYFSFGNVKLSNDLLQLHSFLQESQITVGQIYGVIQNYKTSPLSPNTLFSHVYESFK